MSEQPKALALADALEHYGLPWDSPTMLAAAELRRLHECERDAMRYRWLIESSPNQEIWFCGEGYFGKRDLDAAIDAAKDQA